MDGYWKGFQITPWGLWGTSQATLVTKPGLNRTQYGLILENNDPRLTFGLEYATAAREVDDTTGGPYTKKTVNSPLVDGFVVVRPQAFKDPKHAPLGIVLRYDKFIADNSSAFSDRNETFWLFGVFYDVAKSTSFGLTYQQTSPNSGAQVPFKTEVQTYQLNWQLTF